MERTVNLCPTCFSEGRRLVSTSVFQPFLDFHFPEIKYVTEVCWECHRIIMKFYKFKNQVILSQSILKIEHQKSFSKLCKTFKQCYDIEITYNPIIMNKELDETEKFMKLEIIETNDFLNSFEYESDDLTCMDNIKRDDKSNVEKKELEIFVDNIQQIKEKSLPNQKSSLKKIRAKKKIIDSDMAELKDKLETVYLNEEEMLRNREEKRNQPNFKKIPFKCDSCVLGFTRKEYYDLHVKKKHDLSAGKYVCNVCATRFTSASSLSRHHTKHYQYYKCTLCGYKSFMIKPAINHCRDKHANDTEGRIHCKQCNYLVKTSEELTEHCNKEHTLYCKDCGQRFKGRNTLRTHQIRSHAIKREFSCDVCTKSFKTKSRLESHLIKHSDSIAKKLSYCSLCRIQYKDIYVYRNHVRNSVNHVENTFTCPVCNKKFASKVYGNKHYNFYHLKKSKFKCELCDKLFMSKWRLKDHKQKHHGLTRSRDHACTICNKKFYTMSALRCHVLTHSGVRSHMCAQCGDTFKQSAALYTHMRLLHSQSK